MLSVLASPHPASAEITVHSFTFQNDAFFDHDGGGYTDGLFYSNLRLPSQHEDGVAPPLLLMPLLTWLDMPRPTLGSWSIGQLIITPRETQLHVPDPLDSPYVGVLVLRSAEVSVRDDIADMMALSLGVIGPASGAARTQRFTHQLTGASRPAGWSKQVNNGLSVGIERYRAWRVAWDGGRSDLVAIGGGAFGNRESSVGGTVLLRYGSGLERSFPTLARLTGRAGDPIAIGRGWSVYAGIAADRRVGRVGIGTSPRPNNQSRLRNSMSAALVGITYGWERTSLSFSAQSGNPLVAESNKRQLFGSLTVSRSVH